MSRKGLAVALPKYIFSENQEFSQLLNCQLKKIYWLIYIMPASARGYHMLH